MPKTNNEHQMTSFNRRQAAYNALKAAALAHGMIAHERDGEGVDRILQGVESGAIVLSIQAVAPNGEGKE